MQRCPSEFFPVFFAMKVFSIAALFIGFQICNSLHYRCCCYVQSVYINFTHGAGSWVHSFPACYRAWVACLIPFMHHSQCTSISSTHHSQCTSIISWFVADNIFVVYNLLFYWCNSGVLIVMFQGDMCSHAFLCLVFLVDGLLSLPFFIYWVFLSCIFTTQTNGTGY